MSNAYRAHEPDLPHANDELMTLKEVAALVRVPEATLRYWRHRSKGPRGFRVGRSDLVRVAGNAAPREVFEAVQAAAAWAATGDTKGRISCRPATAHR